MPNPSNHQQRLPDPLREATAALDSGHPAQAEQFLDDLPDELQDQAETSCLRGRCARARGDLAKAAEHFREALARDPALAPARCELGRALGESGDFHAAIHHLQRAMSEAPASPDAFLYVGTLYARRGDLAKAKARLRTATQLAPRNTEIRVALSDVLTEAGEHDAALRLWEAALATDPQDRDALLQVGMRLSQLGRHQDALTHYQQLLEISPNNVAALVNSANSQLLSGDAAGAEQTLRRALAHAPQVIQTSINLAALLRNQGRSAETIELLQPLATAHPEEFAIRHLLGQALTDLGRSSEAVPHLEQAVALRPDNARAWADLGGQRMQIGDYDGAIQALQRSIQLHGNDALPYNILGVTLLLGCRLDEAIACFQQALRIDPNFLGAASNLLYAYTCSDQLTPDALAEQHRDLGSRFAGEHPPASTQTREHSDGKIRIGILSADLRSHSVAFFLLPLLRGHDPAKLEFHCYSSHVQTDAVSAEIRGLCASWHDIARVPDDAVIEQLRGDQLDILLDLSGHTSGNRLLVFPARPAPVQATWLGYPNSTGVSGIDYRISDPVADPEPEADAWHSERLLRLAGGFLCYQPPADCPQVSPTPALEAGHLTFGSFNNLVKASPSTLRMWARALHAVPNSRMYIKSLQLRHPGTQTRLLQRFAELGIAPERISLEARTNSLTQHLERYARVDIALDTIPYNGTTTTCEALWMGVPVLSPTGPDHRSRVSASILAHAGLFDLRCDDVEQVLEKIVRLSQDPRALDELRQGIRARMRGSALMDGTRFRKEMTRTFEHMLASDA